MPSIINNRRRKSRSKSRTQIRIKSRRRSKHRKLDGMGTDLVADDCPICFEKNLNISKNGYKNYTQLPCCGIAYCKSCEAEMKAAAVQSGKPFTCPMCRTTPSEEVLKNFNSFMKHAQKGHAWAQYIIGTNYYIDKDYKESYKWITLSANQGYAASQYVLSKLYENGLGVEQSDKKSVEWLSRAAENGENNSQGLLSSRYFNGDGVEKNYELAFKWCLLAAQNGNIDSQMSLGALYYNGYGVKKNFEEGFKWSKLSAENGNIVAQCHLGDRYRTGEGVKKNYEESFKWFLRSAENGFKRAQVCTADYYRLGEGTTKSNFKSIYWFRESIKDNDKAEMTSYADIRLSELLFEISKVCVQCEKLFQDKVRPLKCSRCESAYYCNRDCQSKHWNNGHKDECRIYPKEKKMVSREEEGNKTVMISREDERKEQLKKQMRDKLEKKRNTNSFER